MFPDIPSESLKEEPEGEKSVLEALIFTQRDEIGILVDAEFILFLAVEGEKRADDAYKCAVCDEEWEDLEMMHQHLLCHSNSKFYLCVQYFEGFNTLFEMKRHTTTHIGEEHPTEQHVISRLRHRVLNAIFDPEGYHLDDADEEEGASSTTAS
uniref:Transcription factor Ovo 1 like n=1 Tax=Echinococcus granulosus TaxID=6210 RepID=U6FVF8_ECHGR|nr:transcription factor Ovo 1 like [Echinococcus granulosus]